MLPLISLCIIILAVGYLANLDILSGDPSTALMSAQSTFIEILPLIGVLVAGGLTLVVLGGRR